MKRLFTIAPTILAISWAGLYGAGAADLIAPVYMPTKAAPYAAPAFSWTGFYVGGNIGGGWAARPFDLLPADPNSTAFFATLGNPGSLDPSTAGLVGGGQAGYNMQLGSWVFGAEFMFDWSNMSGSASNVGTAANGMQAAVGSGVRIDWDGAINARVGFTPWSGWLISAFGGFAFGNISENANVVCIVKCGAVGFSSGSSNAHTGWDAGAEVKYALTSNVIAGVKYRYVDLGTQSLFLSTNNLPPMTFNGSSTARWNEALFTIEWKF